MIRDRKLEVSKVANRLNVSAATVYRLVKSKELAGIRFGNSQCIRIKESSVEEFEARRLDGDSGD